MARVVGSPAIYPQLLNLIPILNHHQHIPTRTSHTKDVSRSQNLRVRLTKLNIANIVLSYSPPSSSMVRLSIVHAGRIAIPVTRRRGRRWWWRMRLFFMMPRVPSTILLASSIHRLLIRIRRLLVLMLPIGERDRRQRTCMMSMLIWRPVYWCR